MQDICQEHSYGHGSDASWHGGDVCYFCNVFCITIAWEFSARDVFLDIDADIDHERSWMYHIWCDQMFFADSRDDYVSMFCMKIELFCSAMADGDSCSRMDQEKRKRLSDDRAFAYDDDIFSFKSFFSAGEIMLDDFHDSFRGSWYESWFITAIEFCDIRTGEAIDIFLRIDRIKDRLSMDMFRKWGLHEDAVCWTSIEFFDVCDQVSLWYGFIQMDKLCFYADAFTGFDFIAHIHFTGTIISDHEDRQMRGELESFDGFCDVICQGFCQCLDIEDHDVK